MEINPMDYVTESEIKDTILNAVARKVEKMEESEIERIYMNACYKAVTMYSDEVIANKELGFSIEEKVKEIISELSSFTVFYSGGGYSENSEAYDLAQKIVVEEKEGLRSIIKDRLSDAYSTRAATLDVAQMMSDYVYELFSIKKAD